jgi:hypothetical protein
VEQHDIPKMWQPMHLAFALTGAPVQATVNNIKRQNGSSFTPYAAPLKCFFPRQLAQHFNSQRNQMHMLADFSTTSPTSDLALAFIRNYHFSNSIIRSIYLLRHHFHNVC